MLSIPPADKTPPSSSVTAAIPARPIWRLPELFQADPPATYNDRSRLAPADSNVAVAGI